MRDFVKAFAGIVKNIGKVVVAPVAPSLALTSYIMMKSTQLMVDAAATGSAYWIKNNFTGQSTLFGASTALTALSDALGKWNSNLTKFYFSAYKDAAGIVSDELQEFLQARGFGTTGSWDNDPLKNDIKDMAILNGKEAYEHYVASQKEKKLRQLDKLRQEGLLEGAEPSLDRVEKIRKEVDDWLKDLNESNQALKEKLENNTVPETKELKEQLNNDSAYLTEMMYKINGRTPAEIAANEKEMQEEIAKINGYFEQNTAESMGRAMVEINRLLAKVHGKFTDLEAFKSSPDWEPNKQQKAVNDGIDRIEEAFVKRRRDFFEQMAGMNTEGNPTPPINVSELGKKPLFKSKL